MPSRIDARPAEPFADVKARAAEAVEAARDEILDLSHRIHANPEPAFEEHRAAAWVADVLAGHGFAVERPAGRLETAVRARLAGGLGTDGPRIGVLAEYDALPGLGHGCGHNTMAASGVGAAIALAGVRSAFAGEIVFLGTPGGGAGERQAVHDRRRAVRGPRRGPPVPPLRPQPRRLRAARVGGRVGRVPRAPVARVVRAVGGPQRARRDDRAVLERGPVAPAAAAALPRPRDHPGGRHRREHHPGPHPGVVHDPERRPGLLRGHEGPLPPAVRGRRGRRGRHGRGRVLGLREHDEDEPARSPTGGSRTPRRTASRTRARTARRAPPTWRTCRGRCPTIHPDLSITDVPTPGHSIEFRDAAGRPRADETVLLAATLVAQTALDLFLDPSLVEQAWAEFRG